MKVFNCIIGIFAVFASFYCIFYPGITFLNSGWALTVLLGAWGICAIFNYFSNPSKTEKSKSELAMGTLGLVIGIAAAVFSLFALSFSGISLILDVIILCMFIGWLIISGIDSITLSFKIKKTGSKRWILSLILGILVLLSGIYGIFHLIVIAQAIGTLIALLLMFYGLRLILSLFEKNR